MRNLWDTMSILSPNTGDISDAALFIGIGAVALALIVVCVILSKRRKK